jgi:hypothetical protein
MRALFRITFFRFQNSGAGGGWRPGNFTSNNLTGLALLQGGTGGKPCYFASDDMKGTGGFGGGGGGCVAGGGGGGFTGECTPNLTNDIRTLYNVQQRRRRFRWTRLVREFYKWRRWLVDDIGKSFAQGGKAWRALWFRFGDHYTGGDRLQLRTPLRSHGRIHNHHKVRLLARMESRSRWRNVCL